MRRIDLSSALVVIGLAALGAGIASYDWRLALIVLGALLFVIGGYAELRGR